MGRGLEIVEAMKFCRIGNYGLPVKVTFQNSFRILQFKH
jgi:hypothetical protein